MPKSRRQQREERRLVEDLAAAALWFVVETQHPLSSASMRDHEYQRMERIVDDMRANKRDLYSYLKGVE